MQSGRYDLAAKQIPDLSVEYQRLKNRYLTAPKVYQEAAERSFVKSTKEIIKMAAATNQLEVANNIANDADRTFSDGKFESFLINLHE